MKHMFFAGLKRICVVLTILIGVVACGGGTSSTALKLDESEYNAGLLQSIPYDVTRKAIRLFPKSLDQSEWQVLREWPRGEIRIAFRSNPNQTWRQLHFPSGATALLRQIVESSDSLYLFTYDFEKNVPSGRGLLGVGTDLWRVDRVNSQVTLVAQGLQLGGIDNLLTARAKAGNIDVCTINKCLRIGLEGEVREWALGVPQGYELVELEFTGADAYALVRQTDDGITGISDFSKPTYAVATLRYSGSTEKSTFLTVPADCLPFRISWVDGQPNWSCAKKSAEMAEVLLSDLRRIPNNGLGDIGLPNSEGRIAWGLAYHLNALVHLTDSTAPKLAYAADWSHERAVLRGALDLVARQDSATEIGHAARRYSQDRSPLLFALHLGRIAQLLSAAEGAGFGSVEITRALNVLRGQLLSLEGTVEVRIQEGSYSTLGYRKGSAFWADGSNVPFNYVSGYVHGLLASGACATVQDSCAEELMRPVIEVENLAKQDLWQYWWGRGRSGWSETDGVSINTPAYSGYSGLAHITYRSMDAMAVLRMASVTPSVVDAGVIQNIRRLVGKGYLLPFVNQELVRVGGTQILESNVAMRYARSAASWELQAQIFALESLIDKN